MTVVSVVLVAMGQVDWRWGVRRVRRIVRAGTWTCCRRAAPAPQLSAARAFPLWARTIGPEIRQYFIQADIEKVPFSRDQRSLVTSARKA